MKHIVGLLISLLSTTHQAHTGNTLSQRLFWINNPLLLDITENERKTTTFKSSCPLGRALE